jgi:uncharacterized protein (DUF2236 family)
VPQALAALEPVRRSLGDAIRFRVNGPDARERLEAVTHASGPRWFPSGRPIRTVHTDVALFIGGVRALLLQSLHPLAMAGVAEHSDYRDDPWGRLQRTAHFLGLTTFGTVEQAETACAAVVAVHRHIHGIAPDGRTYDASDPHLLAWVHIVEVDSFLSAHQRYGEQRLTPAQADGYVADMAQVARQLGIADPPLDVAAARATLARYRPELRGTKETREAARFLLAPPLPIAARAPYAALAAAAVGLLPAWARLPLRLPWLPVTETLLVRPAGRVLIDTMRWALGPSPQSQ